MTRAEPVRHDIPSAEALSALADEIEEMTVPVPRDLLLMKNERALIVLVLRSHASLKARILELERVLREARRYIDPDGDPTALKASAVRDQIDTALEAKPAGETENG